MSKYKIIKHGKIYYNEDHGTEACPECASENHESNIRTEGRKEHTKKYRLVYDCLDCDCRWEYK